MPPEKEIPIAFAVERLIAALGREPTCGACGYGKWSVNVMKQVIQPPGVALGVQLIGGPFLALMALGCRRCGHEDFYNLVSLGVVPNATGEFLQPEALSKEDADARRLIDEALDSDDRGAQHEGEKP